MMLTSPETHQAYADIVVVFAGDKRLRTRQVYALFPDQPKKLLSQRLRQMEAAGYLDCDDVCVHGHGGRLYRLGPTSLPVFDSGAERAIYERARAMYARLATCPMTWSTAPDLHRACNEGTLLAITASRLMAWERAGKVRCNRETRPYRWFALHPALQSFDQMVAAEALRRSLQGPMPEAHAASLAGVPMRRKAREMKAALAAAVALEKSRIAQAQAEKDASRALQAVEDDALAAMAAAMPVAPWIAALVRKPARSTSWAGG